MRGLQKSPTMNPRPHPVRDALVRVVPLSAEALAAAKTRAGALFSRHVNTNPATTPTPLLLGPSGLSATSGAIAGDALLYGSYLVSSYGAHFELPVAPNSNVELDYRGLTKGSLYLVDCVFQNASNVSFEVWDDAGIHESASGSTSADTNGHVLASFLAPSATDTMVLLSIASFANAGAAANFTGCTLHSVS